MDKTTNTTEYCSCAVVRCAIGATHCPKCSKPFQPAPARDNTVVRGPIHR